MRVSAGLTFARALDQVEIQSLQCQIKARGVRDPRVQREIQGPVQAP